jgi:hypothetical protein
MKIFQLLGSPPCEQRAKWPSYSEQYPLWTHGTLMRKCAHIDPVAVDLLFHFLTYGKRLSAKEALQHPYLAQN